MPRIMLRVVLTPVLSCIVLSGCGSASSTHGALRVRALLYGGPARPDGREALDGAPETGDLITVVAGGRTYTSTTDKTGTAVFNLGSYSGPIHISEAGAGAQLNATVPAAKPIVVALQVP